MAEPAPPIPVLTAPIVTSRLILRARRASDTAADVRLMTDPEAQRYFHGPLTPDIAHQRAVAAIGRPGKFCVTLRTTEEPIGFVGIGTEKRSGDLGVAYAFLREHWGHGYAREAVSAVLAWVFERQPDASLRRIVGVAAASNERSVHLLERVSQWLAV